MYGIYANIGGIVMVNVTIYGIHGSYGKEHPQENEPQKNTTSAWRRIQKNCVS
jgi:hypothetical protein